MLANNALAATLSSVKNGNIYLRNEEAVHIQKLVIFRKLCSFRACIYKSENINLNKLTKHLQTSCLT